MAERQRMRAVLREATAAILRESENEIMASSQRLADSFLSNIFRSFFKVEKSAEISEPRSFSLADNPDRIMTEKLSLAQFHSLPAAVMNGEVLCRDFRFFSDMDFILVPDLSLSMLYRWNLPFLVESLARSGGPASVGIQDPGMVEAMKGFRNTKIFALEFLAASLLYAAVRNSFTVKVFPAATGIEFENHLPKDPHLPDYLIRRINTHLLGLFEKATHAERYGEKPSLEKVLHEALASRKRGIVAVLSDFIDDTRPVEPLLVELRQRHALIVIRINDPFEVALPMPGLLQPVARTWEHTLNLEDETRTRIFLGRRDIASYNADSRRRREQLSRFLADERILFLDLVTDQNESIPGKLESMFLDLIQGG
jgi:hypothetical protein